MPTKNSTLFRIEIVSTEGAVPVRGAVLRLTPVGFLMETEKKYHFTVGQNCQAKFSLAGMNPFFNVPVKVVKTYDIWNAKTTDEQTSSVYAIEMHFQKLSEEHRKIIYKFLKIHSGK